MKTRIGSYTFNPSNRTIAFDGYATIHLDQILLVTNLTRNLVLFQFNDPALGGTVAGNTLTLTRDTSAMANTDQLQIFYDDPAPGTNVMVSGSFTRPNDTTAYAAGDHVINSTSSPTANAIAGCARINGGSGTIMNAILIDSANMATPIMPEVWIFDTPWTPDNDNAAITPADAECATVVAIIQFNTMAVGDATSGAGGNRVFVSDPIAKGFVCGAASTSLFWMLVTRSAFTPVAQEVFTLRLNIVQD